jgi:hypothetical protein
MQNLNDETKSTQIMANDQAIRLYKEIALLNTEQQLYILNRLFTDTLRSLSSMRDLDINGLRGLGKEIWQGIDAQDYVNQERDSWA